MRAILMLSIFACVPAFLFVVAYGLSQIFNNFGMTPFLVFCVATGGAGLSVASLIDTARSQAMGLQDDL